MNLTDKKIELRKFGYAGGVVFLILAAINRFTGGTLFINLGAVGLIFFLLGTTYPRGLAWPYALLTKFSSFANTITTTIFLTIIFYGVITPLAVVMRISRKKSTEYLRNSKKNTYWEKSNEQSDSCEKQF